MVFGKGSQHEIEEVTTVESIFKMIEDISKRDEQFDVLEEMRREVRRKQREDRLLNVFRRRNKSFPVQ